MFSSMLRLCWVSALSLTLVGAAPLAADTAQSVLTSVNAARADAGCGPLTLNKGLMAAAQAHAKAMAERDFFGHTGKDGSKFSSRIRRQGYSYRRAAENIAAGQKSAAEVVQGWLQSPGHRRNILNCSMTETGIAMVYQPADKPLNGMHQPLKYYWVQVFATPK